ncbi:potassium channel family protein [Thiosulfativibrio zosterae]|uniref:Potassium channel domain-containing protein n=1 Tax=Thiosulfativibrio zosterae TaxID=2675053 RepID=A0A6F8PMU1_9GAMM|nr:potassium channel family protein [Thiosulfativibrio zosterae]BBP43431.1 hypothetical protein THMIRHAT_11770 [Thiosulfativibrio zosterae]
MAINYKALLGVAGVHANENDRAQRFGTLFSYLVLLALLGVVVQLILDYSEVHFNGIWLSLAVWWIFFAEFVVSLSLVDQKVRYIRHNWLNLVIIFLAFPWMEWGGDWAVIFRALRLILFVRVLVTVIEDVVAILRRNSFGRVLAAAVVFVVISAAIFSAIEDKPFTSGLWYALVTITTVGYGDVVPLTDNGRFYGAFLIIFGVVLFSLLTANISAFLVGAEQKKMESEILKYVQLTEQRMAEQSKRHEQMLESMLKEIDDRLIVLEKKIHEKQTETLQNHLKSIEQHLKDRSR